VPLPATVRFLEGEGFTVGPEVPIQVLSGDPRALSVGRFLQRLLTTVGSTGPALFGPGAPEGQGRIVLAIAESGPSLGDEGYELRVSPLGLRLQARSPAGLFYGVQTLRQLLPVFLEYGAARPKAIVIPAVEINDAPRFAWRGSMLDVARHFFGVEEVRRYIDLLALHKMNRLHLHLSDDQGWRIEIKSWPNLTAVGGLTQVGGGRGGFYTQDQYREIVAYARERFVEIVPEIDMPGHTNAALASYPELNCDGVAPPAYTDIKVGFSSLCVDGGATHTFIEDVVRELAELTPGSFLHIGGDEVRTLGDEQYAGFIERVQEVVGRRGKRMIAWDEARTANLNPQSVLQHWRPDTPLADVAARGLKLILSPGNRTYLDMQYHRGTPIGLSWAGRIEVKDAYSWDPATLLEGVPESAVLGVEAPLWSETLTTMSDVEWMAFPRLAALAEVGWSAQKARTWEDFRLRLGAHGPRLQALGVNFYRSPQIPWLP